MRLNQLRVSGFKSFPDQAEVAFDAGVTAIVGPNGCGKSNLIDAITWVLGEQSVRSLRGERMEDVIFSGSDGRRPTATAEVRLRFSEVAAVAALLNGNTAPTAAADDVEEPAENDLDFVRDIEVGRRLFRSGESEYLIDGRVCRLRDIQDLLMDSGVGVKAYAVVEQGKIGQILSARPLERRQLLEEAAGVTKYKSRRRAAELKIEAARQNLTRVDDIIFEIDTQRNALKRQAARARRYRLLREDLRRWEKVQLARDSLALEEAIDETERRLADAGAREQVAAARVAELETAHERHRIAQAEADQAATAAREAAHAHELAAGRLQQQIEYQTQQVAAQAATAAALEAEGASLAARRSPLRAELAAQVEAARRCAVDRESAAAALRGAEAALQAAQAAVEGIEGDVDVARNAVFAAANAVAVLQHVLQGAAEACDRVDGEIARLAAEAADLETEGAQLAAGRKENAAAVARVSAGLDEVRAGRADREVRLAEANEKRQALAADARAREQELANVSARMTSLDALVAAREGYGDAARLVLTAPAGDLQHLGAVADHMAVDREHELLVEAGLDDLLHALVVRRERDAEAALAFIAARGAGRCDFLVVEAAEAVVPRAAEPDAGLIPFTDLVRVTGPAAAAIRNLLARRWLAPSLTAASAAARASGDTVVAPDGTVFHGAALIRGGGRPEAGGVLRLRGELQELRVRQASAQAAVRRLAEEQAVLDEDAARAEAELKALQGDEHAREKQLLEAQLRLARSDDEAARLTQRRELIRNEDRRAREERAAQAAKQDEARESIARRADERQAAEARQWDAGQRLADARAEVRTLSAQASEAKVAHAELLERAAGLEADAGRVEAAADDLDRRVQACAAGRQRAIDQQESLKASIADAGTRVDDEVRQLDARRSDVRDLDARAAGLRDRIAEQGQRVQSARNALDACRAEVGGLDVDKARAEADRDRLAAACRDAFQLGLEQVRAEVEQLERDGVIALDSRRLAAADDDAAEPEAPPSAGAADVDAATASGAALREPPAEEIVARLRARIERLGPVNMMAIEQFDELEQRHDFLTTQRADLLDSIESTGKAIERINTTTRDRFKQAFEAINANLQQTFSTLFGGGRASLVLLDEADLLESGIDIVAQPPGKRLQSVQLLSGGEKALAAMALMFAIFKYKPSPFCLLDEIDAPLDDANIGRFVEVLRGMQDETQFVLVTHNRKTMEIADRLYGVTMEEPGVSKLVSVWLN